MRNELIYSVCPRTAELCEFRELKCRYAGTHYHTESCYVKGTAKANNAHYHDVNCVDLTKVAAALAQPPAVYAYTGTLPSSGFIGHNNRLTWTVNLPYNAEWTVTANIDTETNYDLVSFNGGSGATVYAGLAYSGYHVGGNAIKYTFTGDKLFITFSTDGSVDSVGFSVTSITCNRPNGGAVYAGEAWGLTGLAELGSASGFVVTDGWLAKQSGAALASILNCGNAPLNAHVCDASCVLVLRSPVRA